MSDHMLDTRGCVSEGHLRLTMCRLGVEENLCLIDTILRNSNYVTVAAALAAATQWPESAHG